MIVERIDSIPFRKENMLSQFISTFCFKKEDDYRLYQIWPGQNQFYLQGFLMSGSIQDRKKYLITLTMLVLMCLTFNVYDMDMVLRIQLSLAILSVLN